jgi:hypothetical protein
MIEALMRHVTLDCAIAPLMDTLIAQGKGDLDFIAVLTLYEALGNMANDVAAH